MGSSVSGPGSHAEGSPREAVFLREHDPAWFTIGAQIVARLRPLLGERVVAVEHVGSTAVPGLAAKPIIDIAVGLSRLEDYESLIQPLAALDYNYIPEIRIPGEYFFRRHEPSAFHLHVLEYNSPHWQNYLFFRDYLCANPQVAQEYIELKRELAERYANDRPSYTRGKAQFIEQMLQEARSRISS